MHRDFQGGFGDINADKVKRFSFHDLASFRFPFLEHPALRNTGLRAQATVRAVRSTKVATLASPRSQTTQCQAACHFVSIISSRYKVIFQNLLDKIALSD